MCEVLIVSQSHQQEHNNTKKKQERLFGVYEQNSIATESETYRIKSLTRASCIGLATPFSRCIAVYFQLVFVSPFFGIAARACMCVCVSKLNLSLLNIVCDWHFLRAKNYIPHIQFISVRFGSVRFGWDKINLQNSVCDCYGRGINKLWFFFCSLLVAYDSVPSLFWSSL